MPRTFSQMIKARREELGLTQKEVAQRVGTTPAYISLLENGKSLPPPRPMVEALSRVLQLNAEELWQAAFKERKRRFIEKAHGRVRSSAAAPPSEASLPDETSSPQLRRLIDRLQENPDLLQACLHLQTLHEAGGEAWTLLRQLIAHHARGHSNSTLET